MSYDIGKKAGECAPLLAAAIERMEADPETYLAMNPPNGWGSYEGLLRALRDRLRGAAGALGYDGAGLAMTTATAQLCGHRWPQIVGGWQKGDDHRCNRPTNHPAPCTCWCGATTTKETR